MAASKMGRPTSSSRTRAKNKMAKASSLKIKRKNHLSYSNSQILSLDRGMTLISRRKALKKVRLALKKILLMLKSRNLLRLRPQAQDSSQRTRNIKSINMKMLVNTNRIIITMMDTALVTTIKDIADMEGTKMISNTTIGMLTLDSISKTHTSRTKDIAPRIMIR